MARHRTMQEADDVNEKMDISSLIDCCFLLLLYFIVATSIGQERKLDMSMPGNSATTTAPKTDLKPGLVTIDANGAVSWGQAGGETMEIDAGGDAQNHELPGLVTQLLEFKEQAQSLGQEPIVQFKVFGIVPHQRVIDVLNAFAQAGIKRVGLTNMNDNE